MIFVFVCVRFFKWSCDYVRPTRAEGAKVKKFIQSKSSIDFKRNMKYREKRKKKFPNEREKKRKTSTNNNSSKATSTFFSPSTNLTRER